MAPGTRIAHHPELIAQLEQDHRELLRIYSGLRRASDEGRRQEAGERLDTFRHEMDRIGKAVVDFLDRYRQLAGHPEWHDDFARELDRIGKVLVDRMRNEEGNLYPLCGPP